MAEVAGLVVGGVSLVTLFDSCMNAFDRIEAGREYGREYNKCVLRKSVLQLRLARWSDAVKASSELGTEEEARKIEEYLEEIQATIEDTENVAKRYKDRETVAPASSSEHRVIDTLTARVRNLAIARQKNTSLALKTRWALRDARKFDKLISELGNYVTNLEAMFPSALPNAKLIASRNVEELIQPSEIEEPKDGNVDPVAVLKEATTGVDDMLEAAIKMAESTVRRGHVYTNMRHGDNTIVQVGNYVAPGSVVNGYGNRYENQEATGGCKVMYGDIYSGKGFWENVSGGKTVWD